MGQEKPPRTHEPGASRVARIFAQAESPEAFARAYFDYVSELLAAVDASALERVVEALLRARAEDRAVYVFGNGGSAATAGHFANDLAIGVAPRGRAFRAVSLAENVALVTAVANDHGYEDIFARQLEGRLRAGDVVIAISASGNSPNVLRAVRYANEAGALTIGLTGGDGGALRGMVQIALHAPAGRLEYGPIEDLHVVFEHAVTNYLRLRLAREAQP